MSVAEDAEWLRWVTKQFRSIVGEDKEIDLEEFKTALQVKEVNAPRGRGESWGVGSFPPGSTSSPTPNCALLLYLEKIKLKNRIAWCCVRRGREKPSSTLQQAGVETTD